MDSKPIAWIACCKESDISGNSLTPIAEHLATEFVPRLKENQEVTQFIVDCSSQVDNLSRELVNFTPIYNLESSNSWSKVVQLAEAVPGIVYLHQLHHLSEEVTLLSVSKKLVEKNIIVLSDPRFLAEFEQSFPAAHCYLLSLPAVNSISKREDLDELSICSAATLNSEDNVHRLLRTLQQFHLPYTFRWMIDEEELEQAENLLSRFNIPAQLTIGRSVNRWRDIAQRSSHAVFLSSSAISSVEPYLLTSIAAGASVVVSSRIQRACYSEDLVVPVTLGVTLEGELRELFSRVPLGVIDLDTVSRFLVEERSPKVLAAEFDSLLTKHFNEKRQYARAV